VIDRQADAYVSNPYDSDNFCHHRSGSQTLSGRKGMITMEIAIVGLGKMGGNMARRLLRAGHRVVGYNRSPEPTQVLKVEEGLEAAFELDEVVTKLTSPRAVWVMVPAGGPTESTINALADLMSAGDIIIDGGNSNYKDSMRRAAALKEKGLQFVDVGTSGGVWGLAEGYSMMVGGDKEAVERLTPILETLAPGPGKGWGHVGPAGSGAQWHRIWSDAGLRRRF
jgi:6-phosphogluconate dehydrogenase